MVRSFASSRNYASSRSIAEIPWEVRYEANELPTASSPAWTKTGSSATEEISPTSFLHVDSSSGGPLVYEITDSGFNSADGITAEARLKIIRGYPSPDWDTWAEFSVRDGSRYIPVYFATNAVTSGLEGANEVYSMDTTDDYHVYRLIVASTTYELYVDGVLRNFGSSIASGGAKVIQFRGDSNGLAGMETSWDYVYYSTA